MQGRTKCTMTPRPSGRVSPSSSGPEGCRRKFLRFFPGGFRDPTYMSWERDTSGTHTCAGRSTRCSANAGADRKRRARGAGYEGGGDRIENESAVFLRKDSPARGRARPRRRAQFCEGLYDFLHGPGTEEARFERWIDAVGRLPRRQTRVLTWPLVTVFGFIAQPDDTSSSSPTSRGVQRTVTVRVPVSIQAELGCVRVPETFAEQAAHGSAHLAAVVT